MLHHVLKLAAALCVAAAAAGALAAQEKPAEPAGPDTVRYTPERGTVTFTHAKHAKLAECSACHHESRSERPFTKPREACGDCHTATPVAPVTTNLRDAFHHPMTKTGICFDCHKKEAAAGKSAPVACNDCHKRDGS